MDDEPVEPGTDPSAERTRRRHHRGRGRRGGRRAPADHRGLGSDDRGPRPPPADAGRRDRQGDGALMAVGRSARPTAVRRPSRRTRSSGPGSACVVLLALAAAVRFLELNVPIWLKDTVAGRGREGDRVPDLRHPPRPRGERRPRRARCPRADAGRVPDRVLHQDRPRAPGRIDQPVGHRLGGRTGDPAGDPPHLHDLPVHLVAGRASSGSTPSSGPCSPRPCRSAASAPRSRPPVPSRRRRSSSPTPRASS